jgi:hypothetical protein
MNHARRCTSLCLFLGLLASALNAQDITKGAIAGIVRDPSGAVISGAVVNLSSPYGDRTTKTGANGEYSFLNLVIGGGYHLSVEQPGFSKAEVSNLSVSVNQQTTSDFTLQVGTSSTVVAVTETATTVDTSSTTIGANLDESLYKKRAHWPQHFVCDGDGPGRGGQRRRGLCQPIHQRRLGIGK